LANPLLFVLEQGDDGGDSITPSRTEPLKNAQDLVLDLLVVVLKSVDNGGDEVAPLRADLVKNLIGLVDGILVPSAQDRYQRRKGLLDIPCFLKARRCLNLHARVRVRENLGPNGNQRLAIGHDLRERCQRRSADAHVFIAEGKLQRRLDGCT